VRVPDLADSEWGVPAAQALAELVGGGERFAAKVAGRVRPPAGATHPSEACGRLEVILTPPADGRAADTALLDSVQAQLLRAGLARLQAHSSLRGPSARAAAQTLAEAQEAALRKHVGIFCYGDPGDSDDDDARA
jgi:staphylococcal nuclease domain-containing protein 1